MRQWLQNFAKELDAEKQRDAAYKAAVAKTKEDDAAACGVLLDPAADSDAVDMAARRLLVQIYRKVMWL